MLDTCWIFPDRPPASCNCVATYNSLSPANTGDCELGPSWLLWLCVVFGVLFLLMLCVNIFLCSAMTCSFSRTELEVEPEEKAASVYTVQVEILGKFR